jgi:hypothetical protein
MVIAKYREWRPVLILMGKIRTQDNDFPAQPLGGKQGQGMGGK